MISRIAAVHSVAPIISDPIYGPKTLNSQLVSGLSLTSGMMPSAPGSVILNLPAHSNITIIPMLQTRKGIFRSATNAAIFVRTLFACDALADVVSVIKDLLHMMIHRCQILKADLNSNIQSGWSNGAATRVGTARRMVKLKVAPCEKVARLKVILPRNEAPPKMHFALN